MSGWRAMPPVLSPLGLGSVVAAVAAGSAALDHLSRALVEATGARSALLTESGTAALAVALRAAASRRSAPAALPGYACYDLVSAALAAGVDVTFYDVDPDTLAPDPASVADALASGVSSLVVVHQYGIRVPLDDLLAQCETAGVPLIEDAAQAWGGSWQGRALGSHGVFGVLSFGRGKGLTGGGGGALLLNRVRAQDLPELERVPPQRLRAAALLAAQWMLARPTVYRIPLALPGLQLGETHFRPPRSPRGMSAAAAAAVATGLPRQRAELDRRRANALAYADALRAASGLRLPRVPGDHADSAWLRFPVRMMHQRDAVATRLRTAGVAAGYPIALPQLPQAASILRSPRPTPGADALAAQTLTLPTHSMVTPRDRQRIIAALLDH